MERGQGLANVVPATLWIAWMFYWGYVLFTDAGGQRALGVGMEVLGALVGIGAAVLFLRR